MASLKRIASRMRETAQDGMGWIALWRRGRSWEALEIMPEDFDYGENEVTLTSDDAADVNRILKENPNAVFLNSYYHNLGMFEGEYLTVAELERKLRWQYMDCGRLLSGWTVHVLKDPVVEGSANRKAQGAKIQVGMQVYTPRFCTVTIDAVFAEEADARACGYAESTYYDGEYQVLGKTIGENCMRFAAVLIP